MPSRLRPGAWLAAAALAAAAGCGSTVSPAQQAAGAGGLNGVTAANGGTNPAASGGLALGPAGSNAAGAAGAATGSAGAGGAAGPSGSGTSGTQPAGAGSLPNSSTTGVSPTTISVGIGYTTNADAANAALGAANVTNGNEQADAQAVINDINAHGGVAHRKLVPVWNSYNGQSTEPGATVRQRACSNYTQDHHVFAVIDQGDDQMISCVTKTALMIGGSLLAQYDDLDFARYPYFVDPGTLDLDSQAAAEVPMWVRQGYFSPWDATTGSAGTVPAKVGILSVDVPSWNEQVDHALLPLLAKNGIHVAPADIFRIYSPPAASQDGTTVADIQNATLKMRTDGVTHVIDLDANGSLTLLFANDAYSQHYYPRLGINSAAGLQALQGDIQPASKKGAEGLGWFPVIDLPSTVAADSSPYSSPARRHCVAVMNAAGQTFSSTNAEQIALTYCDNLYLLKQILDGLPIISRNAFVAGYEQLGSSFPAAEVPQLSFGPGHHDGIVKGWDMRYDSSCDCLRYYGSPVQIP